jgi:hypothetical protein
MRCPRHLDKILRGMRRPSRGAVRECGARNAPAHRFLRRVWRSAPICWFVALRGGPKKVGDTSSYACAPDPQPCVRCDAAKADVVPKLEKACDGARSSCLVRLEHRSKTDHETAAVKLAS